MHGYAHTIVYRPVKRIQNKNFIANIFILKSQIIYYFYSVKNYLKNICFK